ncbi:uncharacterized protein LOC122129153, partial [Clupea harengus]|uniref:Uncharacterized protein LOC122129153 n=1 Tax=Clupea harengus TaxID=7950 RepID=A0A8M1K7Z0_CLUHA
MVLTELDDVRAQGSQEGMSCRRKERQDTEDLEAFWDMREITFVELNDHVTQAIRGQASLPQLELLINEIEGKETFIYNVLKLGQVGLGHEMFDIMIRQLRSLKRMRDEAWRCLNVKVSPEKGTRGGKQDKRTVRLNISGGVVDGARETEIVGDSSSEEERDTHPQADPQAPLLPLRFKTAVKNAAQIPFGKVWGRDREDSDLDEEEDSEIAEQCSIKGPHTCRTWGHSVEAGLNSGLPILQENAPNFITHLESEMERNIFLGSMPRSELKDGVTHYVILHRKTEDCLQKQDIDRQRKLVQSQLNYVKGMKKAQTPAPGLGLDLMP